MAVQPLQVRIEGVDEGADRVVEAIPLAKVDPIGPGELVDDILGVDLNAYDEDNPFAVADSVEPLLVFQSTQTVFACARRRSSRLTTNSFCSRT